MNPRVLELAAREGRHPTWDMALLYPDQGGWTVDDYLALDVGRHVELDSGCVEFQPMPDMKHQAIVFLLVQALKAYCSQKGGKASMAPFPIRLWAEKFREPDAFYMKPENLHRCHLKHWEGADLAVEVVSDSNRKLDEETKRSEYARAGIPEYWLVDPACGMVTALVLGANGYETAATWGRGQVASAQTLRGLSIGVAELLDAE